MASLRRRSLLYLFALAIPIMLGVLIPITLTYSLLTQSLQIYDRNKQYQEVDRLVFLLDQALNDYLLTKSTDSLRYYLEISMQLREAVPQFSLEISEEQIRQGERFLERSAHYLLLSLQETADQAVQAKRGRSPELYAELYAEVRVQVRLLNSLFIQLSQNELTRVMEIQEDYAPILSRIQQLSFLFLISLMIFTAMLSSIFAQKIAEPIVQLSSRALSLADGDFSSSDFVSRGSTEVQQLAMAFNTMKHSIQTYITELQHAAEVEKGLMEERVNNLRMKNTLKQAEMTALQSQIQPHFLYNALNTAVQLATIEDADRTSEYIDSLASLLRETLRPLSEATTLGKEIETLQSFMFIMQIRFGTELLLNIDCPDSARSVFLPRLILQPIVENAVQHGFQNGNGTIWLSSEISGDKLLLSVDDDGRGMAESRLNELLQSLHIHDDDEFIHGFDVRSTTNGIGLRNVMYRVRLFTGREDSFFIETSRRGGLCVKVEVPVNAGSNFWESTDS
ncbi:sensor histidine kinase [Spirochaeta dissipatitropha]